jgi:tetratricopeptide (TPR) repeat protein
MTMFTITRYRSYAAAALVGAALIGLVGCAGTGADHNQTVKEGMKKQWAMARVGIVYQLAKQQYEAGEYSKCRETLQQAAGLPESYAPLNILAAKIEIEKGNLDLAYNQLKVAQLTDPSNPESYYFMGVVYQRWQKPEQALENYKLAWEAKHSEAGYMLAVTEMLISMGRLEEAQKLLEAKLDYFEQTAAVRVALGKVYALKHDYVNASRYYRDAMILSPDDQSLRLTYAESLYFSGKYADALPMLEELHRNPEGADKNLVTMLLGRTFIGLHRTRDARFCFQDLTQDNPSNVVAWLSLGRVYLLEGDTSMSIEAANRVLRIEPESVQAMILRALAEQKQKNWKESMTTLETAHRVAPKDSTVLCLMGLSQQSLGQKEKAAACFEQAVTANPQDAWAQQLLAAAKPVEIRPTEAAIADPVEAPTDR